MGGISSIGTIVRNEQMYIVRLTTSYIQSMPISTIEWASISIYKLDLDAMNISSVASQSCLSVMGKKTAKLSFEIADDEDSITVLASNGYTYVYDFESFKVFGKTQLELKNN